MKPGGGKRKGNGYEIKISKILSKWYVKNFFKIDKDIVPIHYNRGGEVCYDYFWRTAGSGAKSTINRSSQTSFTGDITFLPTPDRLKIWIDCKSVKNVTFDTLLIEKFLPEKWYREEIRKRNKLNIKKPVIIIFKLYRKKENYIFFGMRDFVFKIPLEKLRKEILIYYSCYSHFTIMKLQNFLESVQKEDILK